MKRLSVTVAFLATSLFAITACNKAKVTQGQPQGMTATVNNASWSAANYSAQLDSATANSVLLAITGNQGNDTTGTIISLHVNNFQNKTGEYTISATNNVAEYVQIANFNYHIANAGTISINKITSTTVVGTFSFSSSDGTTVTNGQFNAPIQ